MNNIKTARLWLPSFKKQTIHVILTVSTAILLPQIFHLLGLSLGRGADIGQMFLPMYLPIMVASFLVPLPTAIIVAIISPFANYLLCRMPNIYMLPYMIIELVSLAFFCNALRPAKLPFFAKVLISQIASRMVKVLFALLAVGMFGMKAYSPSQIIFITLNGWYGVLLQLFCVPLILSFLEKQETK